MVQFLISLVVSGLFLIVSAQGAGNGSASPSAGGGSIRVTTNRADYAPNDAIAVTVRNTLSTAIYAVDTQASCSILALDYLVNGVWQPSQVAQCPQKRPARSVKIDAGATYTATITAGYPGLQQLPFPAGSYRLVLTYTTSPDAFSSPHGGVTVTSSPIQVR